MKRIALIGLITVFLATVAYALIEPKNVNRAIDWVWSGNITTTGDFTMAEATITSATITNLTFPLTQTITANTYFDDGSGASPSLVFHDGTDEATTFTKVDSGYLTITSEAADGVNILVGNMKVGNGTPGQTINGEDAYIEGLLEVDGVIYADGGVSGAVNGTIGAGTPAAGAFTTVTASTSIKVDANGSTVSQINCGTTTIDAGTTGTTVSLTGCTAATRVFVCPTGDTGSASYFKATPGSGSFIVKSNADPSSCGVVVNWFAIK